MNENNGLQQKIGHEGHKNVSLSGDLNGLTVRLNEGESRCAAMR